ncbi:MAG: hypothetical protein ACTSQY_04695 [Candidatus Odinarchaeia archaeon]
MKKEKQVYEVDVFDNCPNCGKPVYRGRLNSKLGMIFFYRTKHKTIFDKQGNPVIFEEIVRIGNPVACAFKHAAMCRNCLLVFFKAIRYEPTRKGFEERFQMTKKELEKKVEEESKKPLMMESCPICGNKLDKGEIYDYPPSGYMPGLVFKMVHDRKIGKVKEEKVIIAEDFLGSFYEAYFCDSCFTAIGRMEKFIPFRDDFWDRFEAPSKKVVQCLEKRLKNLPAEGAVMRTETRNIDEVKEEISEEVEKIIDEELDKPIEIELDTELTEISDEGEDIPEDIIPKNIEARLAYEYFPSVVNCMEPSKQYRFCPSCGVENHAEREKCRNCGFDFKSDTSAKT